MFLSLVCVLGVVGCGQPKLVPPEVDLDAPFNECWSGTITNIFTEGSGVDSAEVIEPTDSSVQSGGIPVEDTFDIAVSYANWSDASEVYFGALNKEKMAINSVQHLPIYKFNTLEELEQFKVSFGEVLTMDSGYDEVPSFNDTTANYNETFFDENTLMLIYVSATSGAYRFDVSSVFCDGSSFCIHVKQLNNSNAVTDDLAGWFITVAVPDSMVENCTEFDADLNNDSD